MTDAATPQPPVSKRTKVRFLILLLIFLITTINYADRSTFSIAGKSAADDLGLDAIEMGYILSAFAWAYVLGQIPGGALLDRFGTKLIYAIAIATWSFFTMIQGFSGFLVGGAIFAGLFAMRFAVGLAESPSFPGNARLVAAWFPGSERGFASAVFNSAQYFSLVVFAPLMSWLVHTFDWHSVFFVMGGLGLIGALVFWWIIRSPSDHPGVNQAELDYIEAGGGLINMETKQATKSAAFNWANVSQVLGSRMLMGVFIGQYGINVLTYFFVTWFAIYLVRERGLSIMDAGWATAAPALCGFVGGVLGGVISDQLLKRTDHRAQDAAADRHAAVLPDHRLRLCRAGLAGDRADGRGLLRQGDRLARLGRDLRHLAARVRGRDRRHLQHLRQHRRHRDPHRHWLYRPGDRLL